MRPWQVWILWLAMWFLVGVILPLTILTFASWLLLHWRWPETLLFSSWAALAWLTMFARYPYDGNRVIASMKPETKRIVRLYWGLGLLSPVVVLYLAIESPFSSDSPETALSFSAISAGCLLVSIVGFVFQTLFMSRTGAYLKSNSFKSLSFFKLPDVASYISNSNGAPHAC